jgi:hypothetical protein
MNTTIVRINLGTITNFPNHSDDDIVKEGLPLSDWESRRDIGLGLIDEFVDYSMLFRDQTIEAFSKSDKVLDQFCAFAKNQLGFKSIKPWRMLDVNYADYGFDVKANDPGFVKWKLSR